MSLRIVLVRFGVVHLPERRRTGGNEAWRRGRFAQIGQALARGAGVGDQGCDSHLAAAASVDERQDLSEPGGQQRPEGAGGPTVDGFASPRCVCATRRAMLDFCGEHDLDRRLQRGRARRPGEGEGCRPRAASGGGEPSVKRPVGLLAKHIFSRRLGRLPGLVQQTVQIVASLRSHAPTSFVSAIEFDHARDNDATLRRTVQRIRPEQS